MNSITRYAAVNTKIRALEGQFLSDEDYKVLLSKNSIQDIVRFLKQTNYQKAFINIDETSIHRGQLEGILKRYAIDEFTRLSHYFQGQYSKFLKVLFMRFEIEDLKVLIRAIYTDRDYINSQHSFIYIGRYGELNLDKLVASNNFSELVSNLKGTAYYQYLSPLTLEGKQEDQFQIEMALDLAYISIYKRHIELLTGSEKQMLYKIQGMRADLLNLQWIYRGIKFYSLPSELLLNYSISFGGRLNYKIIKDLCYSKDISVFEEKMRNNRYSFLFEHDRTKDMFMERRMYRYQYYKMLKFKRMNSMDIVQTIVFFELLDYEIRDITTIVENIRYDNEDLEQIKRCLIRDI